MEKRKIKPPPGGWPQKTTGSTEPMPGRCGARLSRTNPPRYCMMRTSDGGRCSQLGHDGGKLIGSANGNFKHGRNSKFLSVLPPRLAKHFDLEGAKKATSSVKHIALVDARVCEVLENIQDADPTGVVRGAQQSIALLKLSLDDGNIDSAKASAEALEAMMTAQMATLTGWDELHRLFDSRVKLSRDYRDWAKLQSERIMLQHLDSFLAALVGEARLLSDDPQRVSIYVQRVRALASGIAGLAGDTIEGEVVEGSGE